MKKIRIIGAFLVILVWAALCVYAWVKPADAYSVSERSQLDQKPDFTLESFASGEFAKAFESYTLDQFPLRDSFRQLKSAVSYYGLWQSDNNNIYVHNGFVEKLDYPLNGEAVDTAQTLFESVYEKHIAGKTDRVFVAVVPDKGYYLTPENGFPAMDYEKLMEQMDFEWARQIDLTDTLTIEDYYRTDAHWRQEALLPTAQKLAQAMGQTGPTESNYTPTALERPFYGGYYGQAALPLSPDTMYILESDVFAEVTVTGYDELGRPVQLPIYNVDAGDDMYDTFLTGSKQSFLVLSNPNARTDRELVIFRDSFGCSLAPLLLEDYAKVTLIDLRAVSPIMLNMANYKDADVLFLFSTVVLNNPDSFRTGA